MRIYISADIEGVAGITGQPQLNSTGFEWPLARQWMTREVVAAAEACRDAGATEVVVSDGHGNAQNLLLDEMPDYVSTIRSWPRPLMQMEGIERGPYAAVAFIGHHTSAAADRGVLSHTIHWKCIDDIRINGVSQSETTLNATLAAEFGVPTIFCSGDDAYVKHVRERLGDVECVETKKALGYTSVETLKPAVASALIKKGMARGLARLGTQRLPALPDRFELEVQFQHRIQAEMLEYLPWVRRSGARAVTVDLPSMAATARFLSFVTLYQASGIHDLK